MKDEESIRCRRDLFTVSRHCLLLSFHRSCVFQDFSPLLFPHYLACDVNKDFFSCESSDTLGW